MDLLWTAFVLGFVGSLHCAAMCGPLALAVPVTGRTRVSFVISRLVYNLGRIATYSVIGLVFGALGRTLVLAGLHRWTSMGAGALIILVLLASWLAPVGTPVWRLVAVVKRTFGTLLHKRSYPSLFALGAVNGVLPCGLVYVAAAGAVATTGALSGLVYMGAFGLGTLPMMLGLGLAGKPLRALLGGQVRAVVPASVVLVALLLVLRGMELGIPILSPIPENGGCH